jgi:hypothetical protein
MSNYHYSQNSFDIQSATEPKVELEKMQSHAAGSAELIQKKQTYLVKRVEEANRKSQSLLGRLSMSKSEKELAQVHMEKQTDTLETIMDQHNLSIKAIAQSQTTYLRELCNALLLTGRSGLQRSVKIIYSENFVALTTQLDELGNEIFDLVERKLNDMSQRPSQLQKMMMDQIETLMSKWDKLYDEILESFVRLQNQGV